MGNFCSTCTDSSEKRYEKLDNERLSNFNPTNVIESELSEYVCSKQTENLNNPQIEEVDVLVIGAGLSGLASAHYLSNHFQKPISIKVIEARDRPGGRTYSVPSKCCPEVMLDIGGQWIGPGQDRMLRLIKQFNLELVEQVFSESTESEDRLIEIANCALPPLSDEEYTEIEKFTTFMEDTSRKIDIKKPWAMSIAEELDSMSVADYVHKHIKTEAAQLEIFMFVQTLLSCDPDTCSLLYLLFNIASGGGMARLCDGDDGAQKWRVKNGTQQISNRLVDYLLTKNIPTQFNTIVTKIESFEKVTSSKSYCIVSTQPYEFGNADGDNLNNNTTTQIKAKHVVIGMSPLLAINHIKFDPPLPPRKRFFCENILPGQCVKIIAAYSYPFWESQGDDSHKGETCTVNDMGFIHNVYLGSVGPYPALVGLITGSSATTYTALPEGERQHAVFTQFANMYKCDYSVVSNPVEYAEKNWCTEPLSGGCFQGILPPGVLTSCKEDMFSITAGIIHWAGTETSSEFYGYMEGAVETGERCAMEIMHSLQEHRI